jgi:hypothetical protein
MNMVRILQIDDYVTNEVAKVKNYALEHPYDESYRKLFLAGKALPVGDNPDHVVHIHSGYRAVYSISVLNEKKYHHLSVSVEEINKYPGIPEVELILDLFGMGKSINDLDNVWLEENAIAVNLLKEFSE